MLVAALVGIPITLIAGASVYLWGYCEGRTKARELWKEVVEELRDFG